MAFHNFYAVGQFTYFRQYFRILATVISQWQKDREKPNIFFNLSTMSYLFCFPSRVPGCWILFALEVLQALPSSIIIWFDTCTIYPTWACIRVCVWWLYDVYSLPLLPSFFLFVCVCVRPFCLNMSVTANNY